MTNRTTVGAMALMVGLGVDAAETHDTHEHGHAVLKLAQEGTEVVVHFESPLESIVGFEHAPANDAHRAALEEAMELLAVSENILRLPAGCRSTGEPVVDIPHVADDRDDDHDGTGKDAGAVHADHEATAEAGDDHDPHGDGEVHADLEATFRYHCESGPEWLEATAFATFDGLEEVELQAVGPDAAVVETLTAASPRTVLTGF
ncbi:MAG: DUF2796 domain-containing protein [Pseudomonadales bacterium]|nr:DUF2796 domain-containing protein [Pseudomonadales bacterium]